MKSLLFLLIFVTLTCAVKPNSQTIEFRSLDEVTITADYYFISEDAPLIILFHQAGWGRGEYIETAPKLNELGFNCLAVDQRSGDTVNDVKNQTSANASKLGKGSSYLDAFQDMQAALNYGIKELKPKKIIIWGSSYSASLALVLAAENLEKITGILAFSPGEYFERQGKSEKYIADNATGITIPVFITSSKSEHSSWKHIYDSIPSKTKTYFLPKTGGQHGSRALWQKFPEHKDYWKAVKSFLKQFKD